MMSQTPMNSARQLFIYAGACDVYITPDERRRDEGCLHYTDLSYMTDCHFVYLHPT